MTTPNHQAELLPCPLAQSILADCTDATPVEWIEMARAIVNKAAGESA